MTKCLICKQVFKPGALIVAVQQYDQNEHRGADLIKTSGYVHLIEVRNHA